MLAVAVAELTVAVVVEMVAQAVAVAVECSAAEQYFSNLTLELLKQVAVVVVDTAVTQVVLQVQVKEEVQAL